MLKSLPESLDETYEWMLSKIDRYSIDDARRILALLCFASRPLIVHELIDEIAIEIANDEGLNRKRRLQDANDIHGICPGLIEISLDSVSLRGVLDKDDQPHFVPTVRIAHFSVQEYLESERIRHQEAAIFSLSSATADAEISQISLLYLLEPALAASTPVEDLLEKYPLGRFATEFWYHHYQEANRPDELNRTILKLFQRRDSFSTWVRLNDIDLGIGQRRKNGSPIYYASFLGLGPVLDELICVKQPETRTKLSRPLPHGSRISQIIRGGSEIPSNTLQLESSSDSEPAVQHLQEHTSNDTNQNEGYGTALRKMTSESHDSVTELPLDKRADVNPLGGFYGNALQAASVNGHKLVVELLIDKGADVNAQGGKHGNALQAASVNSHKLVVELLIDKGADVNAQGGEHGSALQAASLRGHELVVQLLLDKGADVKAECEKYGNALQAASSAGHESVVQLLLDRGAIINTQGGFIGNALEAASYEGHESVVQLLLDEGADVNAQGGAYGHALQVASVAGHESVVHLLLDKGADVNVQGGFYGNALQAASHRGRVSVVQFLLDKGADFNAQGGHYGNALQAASYGVVDESVVQVLLDKGANTNAQGGEYGNALQAASYGGHESVVRLLLDKGVEVDAKGGWYCTALQAALSKDRDSIVNLLLEKGAIRTPVRNPSFSDYDSSFTANLELQFCFFAAGLVLLIILLFWSVDSSNKLSLCCMQGPNQMMMTR